MSIEGGQSLYRHPPAWAQILAHEIIGNWSRWESEAGQIAQCEQNTQAGDDYLFQQLLETIERVYKLGA